MKISTKGRYALRVMLDLAQHKKEGDYISLKDISVRQELSMKYLEMIMAIMNRAGLVKSSRGKFGGYQLIKEPEEYTVGSILKLTEGSISPVVCLDGKKNCSRAQDCITLPMWKKLDQIIDEYLESVTLADLIDNKIDSYQI
ncbi:MAG: RrF2 family transcriptional regulator [Eubacterium sp.]|jgi:Rrf2 family protein|nr:RrF2 family transcriptional regulator [Eubacterium sp.]